MLRPVTWNLGLRREYVSFQSSPEQYLASVLGRYGAATTYRDQGRARLTYQIDGRQESRLAPMEIWFDRNQLYVEVYDVRILVDGDSQLAWIVDPSSTNHDSQVLSRRGIQHRIDLTQIVADPTLASRLSAGLAGPPPQLEWLFGAQPMKELFDPRHKFQFGESGDVEGLACRSVSVVAGEDQYTFWIDDSKGLVRRIDLPPIVAPPAPDRPPQTMALSLEFSSASLRPGGRPKMDSLPPRPNYVSQFIPLPPAQPPELLGRQTQAFRIQAHGENREEFDVSQQGSDRDLTVIARYSGRDSELALRSLEQWRQQVPESLAKNIRMVILCDRDVQANLPRCTLPLAIDHDGAAAVAMGLSPSSLAVLKKGGQITWVQDAVHPGALSSFWCSSGGCFARSRCSAATQKAA